MTDRLFHISVAWIYFLHSSGKTPIENILEGKDFFKKFPKVDWTNVQSVTFMTGISEQQDRIRLYTCSAPDRQTLPLNKQWSMM